jgi:hypothetical protein
MQEKYGFVYIWYDKNRKMFYIGSHWGTESDGYICSSTWMRNTFNRRPNDFKRRILSKVFTNRNDLLDEEQRYMDMIKPYEFKTKYYNINNKVKKPWHTYPDQIKTVSEKISLRTKEAMQRPEVREKYIEGLKKRPAPTKEILEKRSKSMKGKNVGKITVKDSLGNIFHTTHDDPRWISGELIAASKGVKRAPLSEQHKQKIKNAGTFSLINNKKVSCIHCGFIGNPGNIGRYHNDRCKRK